MESSDQYCLPSDDLKWVKNDSKTWPKLAYEDLVDYLIHKKAYDGQAMKSFRSLYGYNYVQNGWMGDIWTLQCNDVVFMKTQISPSQPGVGRKDYKTWIVIKDGSSVETGHCTCPAGNARSCSHIAALIYAVTLAWASGIAGETCTDKQQMWGKGATQVLSHDAISDMVFERPNPFQLPNIESGKRKLDSDKTSKIKQFIDHKELTDFAEKSNVGKLWMCKGTMLYNILHAPDHSLAKTKDNISVHQEHSLDSDKPVQLPLSCDKCETFYEKFINISPDQISTIAKKTETQSSNMWLDSRKIRITSSRVNDLPKTQRADPNKFINNQIYPRFKGCVATRYGQKFEPVARAWFESVSSQKVQQSGIVISAEEPYIAASPDGFISDSEILEIKCPTRPLNELISTGKYDVVNDNGNKKLNPKGKNGYFTQVQIAMFCTKAILCKFVVWTPDEKCIIDVPYDNEFVLNLLPRIRDFYFKHLLVRLSDEYEAGRLKICRDYRKVWHQL